MAVVNTKCKFDYSFVLILSGSDDLTDEVMGRLAEAGCEDATFGRRSGVLFADFDREAGSRDEAIASAIRAVEGAGAGLVVERVEPETVPLDEVKRRLGLETREKRHRT